MATLDYDDASASAFWDTAPETARLSNQDWQLSNTMNDWTALFDDVKAKGQFGSDAQLADSLGLTRAQISAWRTGKSDLGTLTKLKLLDVLGHTDLRAAILSLMPEKNREQSIAQHLALAERVARGTMLHQQTEPEAFPDPVQQNQLLAALPAEERERLTPHLSPVTLPLAAVDARQA